MTIVHYYLGRPARVWIAANSRRSPLRQAHKGSGRVHSGIPGQPVRGFTPSVSAAAPGSTDLAAGLDPADYPAVPGGVPRPRDAPRSTWGYVSGTRELHQAQVAELCRLMATMPVPSDPRPLR
jgi:hypothetical protein